MNPNEQDRQRQRGQGGGFDDQHQQGRGCGGHEHHSYTRSDERIREDVCERLSQRADIDAQEVSVEVQGGKVTLEGTVPDRRMKHMVEDIACGCMGVQDVDNKLRVPQDRDAQQGDDPPAKTRPQ